ncbi:phage tail protein [Paenibacillus alvei]|uniref:phage tail protein n=1 Tax=Paenibacillus alvei TaxID=44250 RepID=UPI00227DF0A4|nr:phage tail protein [Paenibacillus alvei]MCY9737449.1 phage tail protein [Paenibacillus alvei]
MSSYDLDLTVEKPSIELFLAKPNKKIIGKLTEAYDKNITAKLGNINELTFTLPYEIEKNNKLIKNPNIEKIRYRYLIKVVLNGQEEWYMINTDNDSMQDDGDSKPVTAFLLPYEMNSKIITVYNEESLNIRQVLLGGTAVDAEGKPRHVDGILNATRWELGFVDADFETRYRAFDFSSITVLDAVFRVAEIFKALVVWDTHNRKISFYNPEKYGRNRGLTFSYGHYLKSCNREMNTDEMTTRFKVFGQEGMSIQRVNLTGQNYLEDYTYFLYPFERNDKREVVRSSYYMSDELCHAILDFQDYLKAYKGTFDDYTKQLEDLQRRRTEKKNELSNAEGELAVAKNKLDIENSKEPKDESAVNEAISKKNYWESHVNSKKAEVDSIQRDIDNVQQKIQELRSKFSYSNHFTPKLKEELNDYIIEKEWSNDAYFDDQDLYDEALKEFERLKMPQVVVSIDIVNFLDVVECQRDWGKLVLGDTINIRYERLNKQTTAKIMEYQINDEDKSISLTIANTKDLLTDAERIYDMMYKANGASATIDTNKRSWDKIDGTKSQVEEYINNELSSIKQKIKGGINNSVEISERGILVRRSDEPHKYIVLQNGVIAMTQDDGNTWSTALTPERIIAERVMGKLIAGVNLHIDASDQHGTKTFTVDATGVTINGAALKITGGGIGKDHLNPSFADGLVNLGQNYNGIVIDSANGLVMIDGASRVKTVLNATEGFKFQKNVGSVSSPSWEDRLAYDVSTGNLFIDGDIRCRSLKIGGREVLIGDKISGGAINEIKTDQLTVGSAKITTALIEELEVGRNVKMGRNATIYWDQVADKPYVPTLPSYIQTTKITSTTIESPVIYGGELRGGRIISDTTIDVTTDLRVGNNIYLGAQYASGNKRIYLNDATRIEVDSGNRLSIISGGSIYVSAPGIYFDAPVSGKLPPATFG